MAGTRGGDSWRPFAEARRCGGHAHNKDTGGDCRTDGDEVRDGTDPNSYTTDPSDACRDMAVNAMVTDQTSLAGIVPQP